MEETLTFHHKQIDQRNNEVNSIIDDDSLLSMIKEVEVYKERVEQLEKEARESLIRSTESISFVKDCLVKVVESLVYQEENVANDDNAQSGGAIDDELTKQLGVVKSLAGEVELKVKEYTERRKKEKKELENSVVSLTEENRDISSLLRAALVEKEAMERKFKENKRAGLLEIAERGLHRVGFGFMIATATNDILADTLETKEDEQGEPLNLVSMVEKMMKDLRLEISQLRTSLEDSRSDIERLRSLAEKQTHEIAVNTSYIKALEERERVLAQNVEELLMEINESEAEVSRWKEACELEVKAGLNETEERDKVVGILKQELERTKGALDISNGKLTLKEQLATAAMAAQAAAEKSLHLADRRAAGLRDRIEELTRQLEEPETREKYRHKVRHICWPWQFLKMNSSSTNYKFPNISWMIPKMQALQHDID